MVRTTVVLAVVAALLLGYILVFERGTVSSGELERRKGSVLPQMIKDRVSRLEIQRKGVTVVLERRPDEKEGFELGAWEVVEPYQARADEEAVETLLGELEWMDARRRFEGITDEDRKRFGFDHPRYRVWFTVGKERFEMIVGNTSPRGEGVYVLTPDPGVAHVVGKDLPEALDQSPEHYHTKELHDGIMLYSMKRLRIADAAPERVLVKRADSEWLETPVEAMASHEAVEGLVDAFDALRASRYLRPAVGELAPLGLDAPYLELVLDSEHKKSKPPGAKGEEEVERTTTRLRVGAPCGDHADERYATMGDAGTLVCLREADLDKLHPDVDALREQRLLPWPDGRVEKVFVSRGKQKLTVERDGDDWRYALTGPRAVRGEAHTPAVTDWLAALRAQKASAFLPVDTPSRVLVDVRFVASSDKPGYEVKLSTTADGRVLARRGEEPALLELDGGALALASPTAARFRPPKLLSLDAAKLERVEIRRGNAVERVEWKDGTASLVAPLAAPADRVRTSEVARLLSGLEAERFVADAAEPEHGLGAAAVRVTFDHAAEGGKPVHHVLRLGAETNGGRFAQLDDDPAVFVVGTSLSAHVSQPLASASLLSTPLEDIAELVVESAGTRFEVRRQGEAFAFAGDAPEGVSAEALARAVATLRARRVVAYGPVTPDEGMGAPVLRVRVASKGGETHTLSFGAEAGEGEVHARRDDYPIDFAVAASVLSALGPQQP